MTDRQQTGTAAAIDQRQALIADTLAGNFRLLRFSEPLESEFLDAYTKNSTNIIRLAVPWIFLLQVLYGAAMVGITQVPLLWFTHSWLPITGILLLMWLLLATGMINRQVHLMVACGLIVAQTTTLRAATLLGSDPFAQTMIYYVILQLIIGFTLLRLRCFFALGTALLPAVALFLDSLLEGLSVNWQAFTQYYLITAGLCAVVSYTIERRERSAWLNTQTLHMEMQALQTLRARTDAESRRQSLLGEYLELTAGNLSATEIAGRSLKFLIEHMQGQIGTVYLVNGNRLRRASSWALEGETRTADELGQGETLIGQAAENGRRLRLTHLPANYHPIRTATGSASPTELLVEPIRHQGTTLAVIEIGALQPFSDHNIELIDRIGRAMAGTLMAANARDALSRAGMTDFTL